MSETYWLIKTDGSMEKVTTPGIMTLEKMQELVGGYIEFTHVGVILGVRPVALDAVVNEEGLLIPLPMNRLYPHLAGNIILGRCDGPEFYGVESDTLDKRMVPQ